MPIPTDSQGRKDIPLCEGVLDYFPDALAEVAKLSKAGNDKHNPGQPLHWSQHKSKDHANCIARHLLERGTIDPEDGLLHEVKLAWRALALLQMKLQELGAPVPRGATNEDISEVPYEVSNGVVGKRIEAECIEAVPAASARWPE